MRIDELMINDWVYRPDCYDKVCDFAKGGILGLDNLRGVIAWSLLKPIPLTEQILLNNGFEKEESCLQNYQKYVYYFRDGITVVLDSKWDNAWTFTSETLEGDCPNTVHEFQHLLRICKKKELANNLEI